MHARVFYALRTFMEAARGNRSRTMSPDARGLVAGIGIRLATVEDSLLLPWVRRDETPWSPGEQSRVVASEDYRIREGGHPEAGPDAVVLPLSAIERLFNEQAYKAEVLLKRTFPEWNAFPADAQLGLLAHAWEAPGLTGEVRFRDAASGRRWEEAGALAAAEALNRGLPARCGSQLLLMFRNAAVVDRVDGRLSPHWLYFPFDASAGGEQARAAAAGSPGPG